MNTMKMLVKREYWENKGGMFWAPVVVSAFFLAISFISVIVAAIGAKQGGVVHVNGNDFVNVADFSKHLSPDDIHKIAEVLSMAYLPSIMPLMAVLAFVVFFYSLSSLYDDRKDKSVLFWKSMPISDTQTVLSKLFSILVITPLVPLVVGLAVAVLLFLMFGITAQIMGVSLIGEALSLSNFYLLPLEILACLPIYVVWAFPSVAWFMLVSAWARQVPFLWAVGIPVILGVLLSIAEAITGAGIPYEWYWENIVGRLFGGFVPGVWLAFFDASNNMQIESDHQAGWEILKASWAILGYTKVWIAVALGTVMTYAAIRLRRYRDEG